MASVGNVRAREFQIDLAADAGIDGFQSALAAARHHRDAEPSDTILVVLPRTMRLRSPLRLTAADSGTATAPLVIRGAADGGSTVSGGVVLDSAAMDPAESGTAIPEAVRAKVRVVVLGDLLPTIGPGIVASSSFNRAKVKRLAVFFGNQRLSLARWPATSYLHHADLMEGPNAKPGRPVHLRLPANAPVEMMKERGLWIGGYWHFSWWYEFSAASAGNDGTVTFPAPIIAIDGQTPRYFFANVASALGEQGSYYFDRPSSRIFFIAPQDVAPAGRQQPIVAAADSLMQITGASNIRIENVIFEHASGTAVIVQGADHVTLRDCFVGHTGGGGIEIDGGADNLVERCVVNDVGETGIAINGGDRKSLTPANHQIRDSLVTRFGREMPTYRPGVALDGVGNAVEGSEISQGTHSAIIAHGNDHHIVGNIIHDVVRDSSDAGAIYLGKGWTMRGNVIASNEIYSVTNTVGSLDVVGVYLDDQLSGTEVAGNILQDVDLPVLLGGGRDNAITDNVFFGATRYAVEMDARGLSWQKEVAQGTLTDELAQFHVDQPPWSARYPGLKDRPAEQPGAPVGNVISGNVAVDTPLMGYKEPGVATYPQLQDNAEIRHGTDGTPTDLPDEATRISAGNPVVAHTSSLIQQTARNAAMLKRKWQTLLR